MDQKISKKVCTIPIIQFSWKMGLKYQKIYQNGNQNYKSYWLYFKSITDVYKQWKTGQKMLRNIPKLERKLSKPDAEKYTTKTNPKHEYKGLIQTRKYLSLNNNSLIAP